MKKFLAGVIFTLSVFGLIKVYNYSNQFRYMDGKVTGYNGESTIVTTIDGHIWSVNDNKDHFGLVSVKFDTKGTEDISDDEIILVRSR